MKRFKYIVLAVLVIVAIPLVIALFMPQSFVIERSIVIDRPRAEVFDYIKLLKNQAQYSKWAMIDPQMERRFVGEDGTAGFKFAWDSQHPDVGQGELEIVEVQPGERLDLLLHMLRPFESTSPLRMTTETVDGGATKVTSTYEGSMSYPSNLLCPYVEETVGNDMDSTLTNLKIQLQP